ncbi:hypothetical protein KAV79_08565 [Candidatus Aerophobetes bacterium]|nr:hypothetical protein [Candidatus Aerophobetes bacterium]
MERVLAECMAKREAKRNYWYLTITKQRIIFTRVVQTVASKIGWAVGFSFLFGFGIEQLVGKGAGGIAAAAAVIGGLVGSAIVNLKLAHFRKKIDTLTLEERLHRDSKNFFLTKEEIKNIVIKGKKIRLTKDGKKWRLTLRDRKGVIQQTLLALAFLQGKKDRFSPGELLEEGKLLSMSEKELIKVGRRALCNTEYEKAKSCFSMAHLLYPHNQKATESLKILALKGY